MSANESHLFSTGEMVAGASGNSVLFQQTISPGAATAFTLTYKGATTGSVATPSTETAAALATLLNALAGFTNFPCTVTGPTGGPWVVTSPVQNGISDLITATWTGASGSVTNNKGSIKLADVQSCDTDVAYQAVPLMTSAKESQFSIDTGFHSGKCGLKVSIKDMNQFVWSLLLNAVTTIANGFATIPIQSNTVPQFVRVEFYTYDTNGKLTVFVATKAYVATGINTPLKLADFADRPLEFDCLADAAATGSLSPYGIPLTMIMQQ